MKQHEFTSKTKLKKTRECKEVYPATKKRLLMPCDVSKITDLLRNQNSYAPYELRLLKACESWLNNYFGRKYS